MMGKGDKLYSWALKVERADPLVDKTRGTHTKGRTGGFLETTDSPRVWGRKGLAAGSIARKTVESVTRKCFGGSKFCSTIESDVRFSLPSLKRRQ